MGKVLEDDWVFLNFIPKIKLIRVGMTEIEIFVRFCNGRVMAACDIRDKISHCLGQFHALKLVLAVMHIAALLGINLEIV